VNVRPDVDVPEHCLFKDPTLVKGELITWRREPALEKVLDDVSDLGLNCLWFLTLCRVDVLGLVRVRSALVFFCQECHWFLHEWQANPDFLFSRSTLRLRSMIPFFTPPAGFGSSLDKIACR
jgi:hypothetical protein